MSDVFLSYAREDRESARRIAEAIESQGWSVWWDRKIVAGQAFDRTIEEQLESARAVVVLWSAHSVQSEWVRNEAGLASERELLVPVLIEDVKQPLEFRRRHAANLTGWNGDQRDPEFRTLCDGLAAKGQRQPLRSENTTPGSRDGSTATSRVAESPPPMPRRRTPGIWWRSPYAIGAALVLIALPLWFGRSIGEEDARPPEEAAPTVPGNASTTGQTATLRSRTLDGSSGSGLRADNPAPLTIDTITKVRLGPSQEFYFRLDAPMRGIDLVLDVRLVENTRSNLVTTLSVLDENGGMLKDGVIGFNDIDRSGRMTASYEGPALVRLGLKLRNGYSAADHWVTVRRPGSVDLVPFAGEIVPVSLTPGQTYTGPLDANERVYHRVTLPQGEYQAILDVVRQPPSKGNIRGGLVLLNEIGQRRARIVDFNEIDLSYRKVGAFTVSQDGPVILQTESGGDTLSYSLRLQLATTSSDKR